ncbi:MAG: DUF1800 domain-containing protein [SAR202 cluster bacterium]|jgi:uncharacterized protein (DUF1800 family)|nr:MAG: DUF1800 domain-containing protein [SAR202 cluster bacterium]MQG12208.1 DUF1800 domain-containing protein [SAR202 cluster bacterium]|tara:strand:+ start:16174 stop:17541 length:1368 start_codon:yes stop_codon:yes gene_type:complete
MITNVEKKSLIAHLMRRAGFGCNFDQIEELSLLDYDDIVDQLLNPDFSLPEDQDLLERYFIASVEARTARHADPQWTWRLAKSKKQLEEKISLFWHGLLAVGGIKLDHGLAMLEEIDLFRKHGLDKFKTLLLKISQDPGMMYWLDNQNSHKGAPNENYGRELLELFSMGIDENGDGAYSENDVKSAAKAFTGWASKPTPPPFFLGPFPMEFNFDENDHDNSEKEFLGEKGNFNGEDIVELVSKHPSTAKFICMRLYLYFVSEEENWDEINKLSDVYLTSDGDIKKVLENIFKSDHFKSREIMFKKVKSPSDLVFGVTRLVDRFEIPELDSAELATNTLLMGQFLLNPPSVEGWHEGEEWIDSGSLIERINYASDEISNKSSKGVKRIIEIIKSKKIGSDEEFINVCLEALGYIELSDRSYKIISEHLKINNYENNEDKITDILRIIVSTPDFQYC